MNALLLTLHVAGAGIWLGMDFGTFMSFQGARNKDLSIDQRIQMARYFALIDMGPRTAVVAMLTLGLTMMMQRNLGFIDGYWAFIGAILSILTLVWMFLVWWQYWATHPGPGETRSETTKARAEQVKKIDLVWRVIVLVVMGAAGTTSLVGTAGPTQVAFLGWKMALYALILVFGLGIRVFLPNVVSTMGAIFAEGSTPEREEALTKGARPTQAFVIAIWVTIAVIIWISIAKPA